MKHRTAILATLLLSSVRVLAQDQPPAQPTLEERVRKLEDRLDSEGAASRKTTADVEKLRRISLSGYVQTRWNAPQGAVSTFGVRRARVKLSANPTDHTTVVIQPDFSSAAVSVKDAHIVWFPTATSVKRSYAFTIGQSVVPFGYENPRSSSALEFGERSLVIKALFDGEYDRGLKIATPQTGRLSAELGIFNGNNIGPRKQVSSDDNNTPKDLVGRLRYAATGNLDLGTSFYLGREMVSGQRLPKNILGIDLQWKPVSTLSLKAEYAGGLAATKGTPTEATNVHGWYAQAGYAVLPNTTLLAKYDTYRDGTTGSQDLNANIWHVGIARQVNPNLRVLALYDFVHERYGAQKKNNVARFEVLSTF